MRITLLAFLVLFACGLRPAFGQSHAEKIAARDAYVFSNIVSIFYHELGHAIIDKMSVPIFWPRRRCAGCFIHFNDRSSL